MRTLVTKERKLIMYFSQFASYSTAIAASGMRFHIRLHLVDDTTIDSSIIPAEAYDDVLIELMSAAVGPEPYIIWQAPNGNSVPGGKMTIVARERVTSAEVILIKDQFSATR